MSSAVNLMAHVLVLRRPFSSAQWMQMLRDFNSEEKSTDDGEKNDRCSSGE